MAEKWKNTTIKTIAGGFSKEPINSDIIDKYEDISKLQILKTSRLATLSLSQSVWTSGFVFDYASVSNVFSFYGKVWVEINKEIYSFTGTDLYLNSYWSGLAKKLSFRSVIIFGNKAVFALGTDGFYITDDMVTFTLISGQSVNHMAVSHNRLYFCYNFAYGSDGGWSGIASFKYTLDFSVFTMVTLPNVSGIRFMFEKDSNNGDLICDDTSYNGTSFYQNGIDSRGNLSYSRFIGSVPKYFLTKINNKIFLSDLKNNYKELKSLTAICAEIDSPFLLYSQFYGNMLITNFQASYFFSPIYVFVTDIINDTTHLIHKENFTDGAEHYPLGIYDPFYKCIFIKTHDQSTYYLRTKTIYLDSGDTKDIENLITTETWNYETQGYFKTPPISFGDSREETLIKAISINTRKLPAGTSVKIYIDQDFSDSDTLKLTHNVTNATNKTEYFSPCLKFNYAKFKVELSGPGTLKPDLIDINILYQKKGL